MKRFTSSFFQASSDAASSGPASPLRRDVLKLGLLSTFFHAFGTPFSQTLLAAGLETSSTAGLSPAQGSDWSSVSPFLRGNYAPVFEERTDLQLEVVGKLPADLNGTFLRNGPNPLFKPLQRYHWFDGDGMVHAVQVKEGAASYRNRFVRTHGLALEEKAGHALYPSMTEPPFMSKAPRGEARYKNTANTAMLHHGGKLLALWEGGNPHELTLPELETIGEYSFQGALKHGFTAHPKVDPSSGELMTFGYRISKRPYISYSVFNEDHTLKHSAPIDIPKPLMMHDFAVTERYTIFMDLPEIFDLWRAVRGHSPLVFRPELGARFGVIPRCGKPSELKWFEIDPCFVFHVLAAWEEGPEVVVVACRYPRFPEALDGESNSQLGNSTFASLYEWRLNLETGGVKERALDDQRSEFPQLNPKHTGRKVRYGYALSVQPSNDTQSELVKYDLQTGKSQRVSVGGRSSEPMFVARPAAASEDDGWLVALVHDAVTERGQLVVLDAASFDPEPVARVLLPVRVPFGFHSQWVQG